MLGAMASSEARHDVVAERTAAASADDANKRKTTKKSATKPPKKKGRWRRRLAIVAALIPLMGVGGWLAVHHVPGVGPWVANTLRSLFGNEFVAWLEDTVYGVEDWVNHRTKADEPPKAFWEVPPEAAAPTATAPPEPDAPPPFTLAKIGPMHENLATAGDGVWLPLVDPRKPDDRVRALKTFVHPDKGRSWSIVAIVAVDLGQVDLHAMAGRHEPESKTKEAKDYERKAVIPPEHHDALIAAFNGGYKSTHGDYGMKIDGVTLVPPRNLACTIAKMKDGSFLIDAWEKAKDREPEMEWLRQTPICMYDDGEPHPALAMDSMGWGASSVSKTTVIRRSALGLSQDGKILFIGIGDHVTGRAIAEALVHAGASDVAQLDVNFSFPKFVLYEQKDEGLAAVPLTSNFEYEADQYVGTRSQRDFFYLARRPEE
jgi:hypothetical protein